MKVLLSLLGSLSRYFGHSVRFSDSRLRFQVCCVLSGHGSQFIITVMMGYLVNPGFYICIELFLYPNLSDKILI